MEIFIGISVAVVILIQIVGVLDFAGVFERKRHDHRQNTHSGRRSNFLSLVFPA